MLRKLRIVLALLFFGLITFYFLDFAELLPVQFAVLERVQFVPALISFSFLTLIVLLLMTLVFGRVYCSVVCPMGVFQDIVNWLSGKFGKASRGKKWFKRRKRFRFSPARTALRWGVVAVVLVASLCGFMLLLGLVEPYSAFGRMVTNVFKPLYMAGNNLLESIFTSFDNYTFYRVDASVASLSSFLIGLLTFLVIGYLAWRHGRAWCNTMCPVGTFLGILSKFSVFKVRIDKSKCTHCMVCGTRCKASCIDSKNGKIDYTRCVDCFDCIDSCKEGALSFTFPKRRPKGGTPAPDGGAKAVAGQADKDAGAAQQDNSRRRFLMAGLTATAAVGELMAQAPQIVSNNNSNTAYKRQHPITPPGSVSLAHFQASCTSCHLCVSKCPSHVLKPSLLEYGLGGLMQPTVYFEKGFCNYDCTVCGDVCPNGAIKPLTIEQKHRTQMGKVVFIKENCIVYLDGTSCGACSEHCPTQALSMVPYKDGLTIPHVDTDICVGCGGCEYVCPARPFRAVYIEGNPVHREAKPFEEGKQEKIEVDDFGF